MALVDSAWYVNFGNGSSTGYYAVAAWAANTAYAAGALVRQNAAPSVGNERVFVCIVAGTSHATTEPTWVVTRGAKTTDNTVTWQECTGVAALNGDATHTTTWTPLKNTVVSLGQVITRDNGASYQICTTAGTAGNGAEPAFSDTAGVTTADNTATWTSLGAVGNYTGWQAPMPRLASIFGTNWASSGHDIYVASEHAETQAATITITSAGTAAAPNRILCVTKTTVPPATGNITTGATIATTGNFALSVRGYHYCEGISFSCGSGNNNQSLGIGNSGSFVQSYKNCPMIIGNTHVSARIGLGVNSTNTFQRITLDNCPMTFGNTSQAINWNGGELCWKNTASAIAGSVPSTLLVGSSPAGSNFLIEGVDLSAVTSGNTLVGTGQGPQRVVFKDCKLASGVTVSATPLSLGGRETYVIRSDSGTANYRHEKYTYAGTQSIETTVVRTGGAGAGTTIAWKIDTTANASWLFPFEAMPISIWNTTTGSSVTVTLYGIWGGGAVPNTDDIGMDVEYLGSSATPIGSFTTTTKATCLATGTGLSSDTSTWGGSTTKFKLTATFTPQLAGPLTIYLKAYKASATFYIDPKPVLS